jgi:hypothetical protein
LARLGVIGAVSMAVIVLAAGAARQMVLLDMLISPLWLAAIGVPLLLAVAAMSNRRAERRLRRAVAPQFAESRIAGNGPGAEQGLAAADTPRLGERRARRIRRLVRGRKRGAGFAAALAGIWIGATLAAGCIGGLRLALGVPIDLPPDRAVTRLSASATIGVMSVDADIIDSSTIGAVLDVVRPLLDEPATTRLQRTYGDGWRLFWSSHATHSHGDKLLDLTLHTDDGSRRSITIGPRHILVDRGATGHVVDGHGIIDQILGRLGLPGKANPLSGPSGERGGLASVSRPASTSSRPGSRADIRS